MSRRKLILLHVTDSGYMLGMDRHGMHYDTCRDLAKIGVSKKGSNKPAQLLRQSNILNYAYSMCSYETFRTATNKGAHAQVGLHLQHCLALRPKLHHWRHMKYDSCLIKAKIMRGSRGGRGGQGVRIPLKNHQNIGFLSNTAPDPRNTTKIPR